MIQIRIENLEMLFDRLIDRLKKDNFSKISFVEDFYWAISSEDMVSFPATPALIVRSLNEDVQFLNSLISEDYSTDYLELEKLAEVLKFIYRNVK